MMNNNEKAALRLAAAEIGCPETSVTVTALSHEGGLYELSLFTGWMRYDCYVDADAGLVLGLSAEPATLAA